MIELYKIDEDVFINVELISEIIDDLCGGYFIYLNFIDGEGEQVRHRVSKKIGDYLIKKYSLINISKKIIPAKSNEEEKVLGYMAYNDIEDEYNHPEILSKNDIVRLYELYASSTDAKKEYGMKVVKIVEVLKND